MVLSTSIEGLGLRLVHSAPKKPAKPVVHQRLIMTEYYYNGTDKYRRSHSTTIEGAIRAAILRVVKDEYTNAKIYDERFGALNTFALEIASYDKKVVIIWKKVPRWKETFSGKS